MEYRWLRKANTELLLSSISTFLTDHGFIFSNDVNGEQLIIKAIRRISKDETRRIEITIEQSDQYLSVIFKPAEKVERSLRYNPLLNLFGGAFLLKRLRATEFYERLESEFSTQIEKYVDEATLSSSASSQR